MGQRPNRAATRRPAALASYVEPGEQIEVSANAGAIDAVQAAMRYALFLFSAVVALLGFFSKHDVAGAVDYMQTNGGEIVAAVSFLIALGVSAYGVFKTHKRGAQVATVAADPRVPETVATLKT